MEQKNVISTIKDNTSWNRNKHRWWQKNYTWRKHLQTTTIADITDGDGKLIITNTNETPESGKIILYSSCSR